MRIHWTPLKWELLKHHKKGLASIFIVTSTIILLHCLIIWEQDYNIWNIPLDDPDPYNILSPPESLPSVGTHKIPKILHQTWKDEYIPRKFVPWIKSWVTNHPDWEYRFWTDESARSLISDRYPHFLPTYDAYQSGIQRADALRYFVLYEYGGVYADLDMENLRALDRITYRHSCFIAQEPYEHPSLDGNFRNLAMNSLIGCRAKHPFLAAVTEALPDFFHFWHVLDSSGPHFLTYVYKKYIKTRAHPENSDVSNDIYLAPPQYFIPTIDPTKFYGFLQKCNHYDTLSAIGKKACQGLKAYGFKRRPLPYTFTIHHWIHSYFENNFSLRSPIPIRDIVKNPIIYRKT